MKKGIIAIIAIIALIAIIVISLLAIMPSLPKSGECDKFHPHVEDFGGPAETSQLLSYLATNMPINVWTDGTKTVVVAVYKMRTVFMAYGTGNPTMFSKNVGIEYIRQQTDGLRPVTSPKGILQARNTINNCLKNNFDASLSSSTFSITLTSPNPYALWYWGLAGIGTLIGAGLLKGPKKAYT